MSLVAGIDIGTSGVKVALYDPAEREVASHGLPLVVQRPRPGWAEQAPDAWWDGVAGCLDALRAREPAALARVAAIGLSGQMLGTVFLDAQDRPVAPAALWNDLRATAECATLAARVTDIGARTIGAPDPGYGAPKLLWYAAHAPEVLAAARMLLSPKDYVRLCLTGAVASEPTDAAGTQLLDVASGTWDQALCAATGWDPARLPTLIAPWAAAGGLRATLAARWGMGAVPVAAGAGDNCAGTLGAGAIAPGDVAISIGTSAVVCAVGDSFRPGPAQGLMATAHAVPGRFLSHGVVMSATASLDWLAALTGTTPAVLVAEADRWVRSGADTARAPVMRPTLSGIRTPAPDPGATGAITGITPDTDRAMLAYAVMRGVAVQIGECVAAQARAGIAARRILLLGGGARSALWRSLVAEVLGRELELPQGGARGASLGAARLARGLVG